MVFSLSGFDCVLKLYDVDGEEWVSEGWDQARMKAPGSYLGVYCLVIFAGCVNGY